MTRQGWHLLEAAHLRCVERAAAEERRVILGEGHAWYSGAADLLRYLTAQARYEIDGVVS